MAASATPTLKLVAPWYRWQRQAEKEGVLPRRSRPVLQKYADPGLVNRFMDEPQASYRFVEEDFVQAREASPYRAPSGGGPDIRSLADVGRHATGVPKLFRPTHKRHYLVVCELHCDEPGLPDARLEHACEMGFVVRRRRPVHPARLRKKKREASERIGVVRAQLRWLRSEDPPLPSRLRKDPRIGGGGHPPRPPAGSPALADQVRRYLREREELRAELDRLERLEGVEWIPERWIPDPDHDGLGRWAPLAGSEGEAEERIHPLHPLAPAREGDPDPARGARMLFGVVPVGAADTDPEGVPRFDADHLYEIRTFVRRHDDRCPRRRERADCPGPLVWSEPTRAFRVASHSDLDGQKNNLVTAEMPDLEELASHPGPAGGIRMVTPDGSALSFDAEGTEATDPKRGGGQICTFPIPLITIVARFVFSLFLPIVVFLFQLFFLLLLKLCIPPSLSIGASLRSKVDALQGAGLSLDGSTTAHVELRDELVDTLNGAYPKDPDGDGVGDALVGDYSNAELWELVQELGGEGDGPSDAPLTASLVPEERVEERPRVDAPEVVGAAP